ncbi:MAG: DUF4190 domain-containing protein [Ruminococcus sp.]|nr:DUF4190 domain-containing protein [Ruminococcus sp.]
MLVFPSHLVASMVLGIVAICLSCFWYIAIPCAIVGLVLGGVALMKISNGTAGGKGMAIAGLVLSIVSIAVTIIVVVALGATIASLL